MVRKEICDFWIGNFDNSEDYFDFVGEDPEFFKDNTGRDEQYISRFAKSQGESWIDRNFMESGFEIGKGSFIENFKQYSYADQWITEVADKISVTEISEINTVIFITKGKIKKPASVFEAKFSLRYIGQIEYIL